MKMADTKTIQKDARKALRKLGTCSHSLFYILNREFGYPMETEGRAIDPLAGGIMRQGYQCGMLWGSALAAGAESYRRSNDSSQAIGRAIKTTQILMESFSNRARSVDCADITGCDFNSKFSMAKYFITGRFLACFRLIGKWAPEAIQSASEGLSQGQSNILQPPISCASEVARRMGAGDQETVMVAGFAGGLGLSGNACGALSAAIWINSLAWCKQQSGKSGYYNPNIEGILEAFYKATDYEILCHKISGRKFNTIDEHTDFIKTGGCEKVINALAQL